MGPFVGYSGGMYNFFNCFVVAFAFTQFSVLGLYFSEVAFLTSNSSSGSTLKKLAIPALIVCGVAWVVICVVDGLQTRVYNAATIGSADETAQLGVVVAALAAQLGLVAFGCVAVIRALPPSQATRLTLLRVCGFSLFGAIMLAAFGTSYVVFYAYAVTIFGHIFSLFWTESSLWSLRRCLLLVCACFST